MAVSIAQIPVWCLNIQHRYENAGTLRNVVTHRYQTALGASRARRLIEGSGARKHKLSQGGSKL